MGIQRYVVRGKEKKLLSVKKVGFGRMSGEMENCTDAYYIAAFDPPIWLYYKHTNNNNNNNNHNNNNNNVSNGPRGGSLEDYGVVHSPSSPASASEYLPDWPDLILAVLFSILIVVTIVGNTLVIAAVITTRRLRSVTNCFVSSLAAADLLVGLAVMPPAVLLHINGGIWALGEILCDSWVSLDVLLCTASILSLCAISIDRYLAVTQPLVYSRRRRSKRLAGLMIVAVWILAGVITSPPLLGCFPRAINRDREKCGYNMDSSYVVFSSMGSFFLPMLVMIYVYARISCVIARRHKSLQGPDHQHDYGSHRGRKSSSLTGTQKSKSCFVEAAGTSKRSEELSSISDIGPGSSSEKIADQRSANQINDTTSSQVPPSALSTGPKKILLAVPTRNHQQQRGSHQSSINRVTRETKTAGTLAVVVGGFIACWLPFFILYLATPFIPVVPPESLMSALTWLGWINSALNPFIYAFYSADFRLAFWRLTFRKCFKNVTPRGTSNVLADRKHLAGSKHWTRDTSKG